MRRLLLALLLVGCTGTGQLPPSGGDDDDDTPEPTPDPCLAIAPLPVQWTHQDGFTGSEDFALDGQGRMVSVDGGGNLVAIDMEGTLSVLIPGLGEVAGIDFLPDGDIAWNDVASGALLRANIATGSERMLLAGLEYPNGLDVDAEGFLYVAEQSGGRVRRVDSETGEFEVLAEGLYAPNGVSFGPDFSTLYVNSFGGGVVWAIDRDADGGFGEVREFATMPGAAPPDPEAACAGAVPGDACMDPWTWALGACVDQGGGSLSCVMSRDVAACDGLDVGAPCTTTLGDDPLQSLCAPNPDGGLFCPRAAAENLEACEDLPQDAACEVGGEEAVCAFSFEGAMVCWPWDEDGSVYVDACIDHEPEDSCVVADPAYPSIGTCIDGSDWGWSGLVCLGESSIPGNGSALDGLNVDVCGNVYLTEYIAGIVWRIGPAGGEPELVAQLDASWIPNMHFGHGVGGWQENVLYVSDRDTAGVYALELGVPGHGEITGRAR